MPTLYTMPGTCALAPNIAVAWLNAPVEINNLAFGDHRKPKYLAINANGKVPSLAFEDGDVLTETVAILEYIGATWGKADNSRDTVIGRKEAEALSYMSTSVYSDFAPHFAVQNFATSRAARDEIKANAYVKLRVHFDRLNQQLLDSDGNWLLGQQTFADAYLHVLTRWIEQTPMSILHFPALAKHRQRMQSNTAVKLALVRQKMKPV